MSTAGFLLILGALFVVVGWYAWWFSREIWCGGWGERMTHSCGYFNQYTFGRLMAGYACPGCGETDNKWRARVGRPTFPWGWEWKEGRPPGALRPQDKKVVEFDPSKWTGTR